MMATTLYIFTDGQSMIDMNDRLNAQHTFHQKAVL